MLPARSKTVLQVLDDNVWEQRAQAHQQASSLRLDLPIDMETDAVLPAPRSQQPRRTLEAATHSQQLPSASALGDIKEVPGDRRAPAPAEQPSKRARISGVMQRPPRCVNPLHVGRQQPPASVPVQPQHGEALCVPTA